MELSTKTPRIEVVDALRGFAVMAILLVHNLEHFIFPVYPESSPEWLSVLDAGVFNAIFSLFAGKSYAIFALLFGFTFYIQSHNQQLEMKSILITSFLEFYHNNTRITKIGTIAMLNHTHTDHGTIT